MLLWTIALSTSAFPMIIRLSDKYHVTAINFEAGDHAIPQTPREIDMALRAAKVAWDRYPYLEHRYGERGRRFTDSDGCWLFTLAGPTRDPEVVTKSLEWLRTVLASRGIPTIILECHLQAILEAIQAEFPERRGERNPFHEFALSRCAERRRLFGDDGGSRLTELFDQRFEACTGFKVGSAAELIISAWVDEHSGIAGAVSALRDWFGDADRFSTDWIATVHDLLRELDRVHEQSI